MDKINKVLEKRFAPVAVRIGNQKHLMAIRNGMLMTTPLIIIGSVFLVLSSLPIPNYADWLAAHGDLGTWLNKIVDGSFGIMGLVAAFGIAYNLAKSYQVDGASAGVISMASFIVVTPKIFDADEAAGLPYKYMGSGGLFVAIIIGLVSTEIYRIFIQKKITIKMPESVPPEVSRSFASMIPGFVVISLFGIIFKILDIFDLNIHTIIMTVMEKPLNFIGSSLPGTLIVVAISSLFWLCGIHGTDVIGSVMYPLWYLNADVNRVAFQAGKEIPNIISYPFMMNFVFLGGGGATLGLAIALVLFGKSKQSKAMGKLALGPGIFNINEPLMFGLPVVMNPMMFIPYIIVPMTNLIICYFTMSSGLVAKAVGINVGWTVPPIISGYLATGGKLSGPILQIALIILDTFIYGIFFKLYDNQLLKEEKRAA